MDLTMFINREPKMNMSSCWQVSFFPTETPAPEFENFLDDYFEVNACNFDDDGNDEYVGYTGSRFSEEEMKKAAAAYGITLPKYKIELLESSNWLKDYVIRFAPFEVEDFLIYGVHESAAPQTDKIPIKIYAATAFGSDHQTTRNCLKAVSELYHQKFKAEKILDIGTGSGILSLAAAKLWQPECQITAVDIDEESVWVTRQNAADNHVSAFISAEVSDGCQADIVRQNAPYDLVLANILARPLLSMASAIHQNLKKGGYCVLSGFVDDQSDWIISEYQKQGLELKKLYKLDNWRAALMQKV